jgi:2-furoyl-CoA dehydrogenase FAD binding subunit
MKPRPFEFAAPRSVAEAVDLQARHGEEARILAGGQTLIAMLNLRLLEPALIIDITRIEELHQLKVVGRILEVGAAVTQNRLLQWPELASRAPLLAKVLPWVGHFQTRNRGTVCGSIAHADPSSELPLALAMLDGQVVLRSKRGTRTVKAVDFQTGMLSTARAPDEMIVAVRFPLDAPGAVAFREVARRHGDFAIVSVAAMREGREVRLGIGGAADRPLVRRLGLLGAHEAQEALEAIAWEVDAREDIHATPRMRRDLLRRIGTLAIQEVMA